MKNCGLIILEAGLFDGLVSLVKLELFDNPHLGVVEPETFGVHDCGSVVFYENGLMSGGGDMRGVRRLRLRGVSVGWGRCYLDNDSLLILKQLNRMARRLGEQGEIYTIVNRK